MSAERVLEVARSQIGYREGKNNSNKYGTAYGMPNVAWCAQFTWWCFREAGVGSLHPKTAYTPTLAQYYKDRGRFDKNPRPGDLVFFDFPDSVRRIQHVGIVEKVISGGVQTIEGNTSSGSSGSQSNGGGVYRRTRTSSIVGFGHPAYSSTEGGIVTPASVPAPSAPAPSSSNWPLLRRGSKGEYVKQLQARLNAWFPTYSRLVVDGDFGPATEAVVKEFQRRSGLTADGIVGPLTRGALHL